MNSGSISRRWARALFDLGEEQGTLVVLVQDLRQLKDAWVGSRELRLTMADPSIPQEARAAIWEELILRLGVSRTGRNFVRLALDRNRISEIPAICRELHAMLDEKENRLRGEVISAAPLDPGYIARLQTSIERATGRLLVLTSRQDPEMIGGMVTRVGNRMYDGSIRAALARAKEELDRIG